jgi:ABC-type proline/glycine betaine transport system, permease component
LLGKRNLAIFTFIGLLIIQFVDLWESAMATLALVLVSSLIALIVGIPIGILASRSERADGIVRPVLDFMQTMPAFVYLIPAIILFERGNVAGTIATVIFAMPPVVRLTNLGIRQVPEDVMEAAKSLGSTSRQLLYKIQLPMALPTILAGINQTIMLALSMVVIASMIGAGGLGSDVRAALSRVNIGYGFEAGIAVVMLAMIIDRISQAIGKRTQQY